MHIAKLTTERQQAEHSGSAANTKADVERVRKLTAVNNYRPNKQLLVRLFFCPWSSMLSFVRFALACRDREYPAPRSGLLRC